MRTHGGEGLVFGLQFADELLGLGFADHDPVVLVPGGDGVDPQRGRVVSLALVHACAPVHLTSPPVEERISKNVNERKQIGMLVTCWFEGCVRRRAG